MAILGVCLESMHGKGIRRSSGLEWGSLKKSLANSRQPPKGYLS